MMDDEFFAALLIGCVAIVLVAKFLSDLIR